MKRPTEALRSAELFDAGIGYVIVSRYKADGRVEAGYFLLDVFCLGAKDASFERFESHAEFEDSLLDPLFATQERVPMAAPLLGDDAEIEQKSAVISLSELAWNYRMSDEETQREITAQIAAMHDGRRMLDQFKFLAARATELFPEEDRLILGVEVELDRKGNPLCG